jgi:hypothetical protein
MEMLKIDRAKLEYLGQSLDHSNDPPTLGSSKFRPPSGPQVLGWIKLCRPFIKTPSGFILTDIRARPNLRGEGIASAAWRSHSSFRRQQR